MISIIVSSYNQKYFDAFSENVSESIGVPYEIIQIWNPGIMGICEAYNRGAEAAQFDYLVFCHEDILFNTNDWGQSLIEYFKTDSNLSAIGFAGSQYMPQNFIGWDSSLDKYLKLNLWQHFKNNTKFEVIIGKESSLATVLCLDGCFIACPKWAYESVKFDQEAFKGFHFYDVDYTFALAQKFKVAVSFDISITHFSEGGYDKTWINELHTFTKKWNGKLPCSLNGLVDKNIEQKAMDSFLLLNMKIGKSLNYYFKSLFSAKFCTTIGIFNWLAYIVKLPIMYIRFTRYLKSIQYG